ncbi:hypothetical protein WBG78_27225 [Chryseolinea sp. T2]|uniref:hypothetical protein n=1 Tax=Chryseolinea sp. T2 TaxID=3129255 RepID=UPI0030776320
MKNTVSERSKKLRPFAFLVLGVLLMMKVSWPGDDYNADDEMVVASLTIFMPADYASHNVKSPMERCSVSTQAGSKMIVPACLSAGDDIE